MFEKLIDRINELQSAVYLAGHGNEWFGLDEVGEGPDASDLLAELLATYEDSAYPAEFISRYTMTECLAERNGVETYVVQDAQGNRYVAKCYDRSVWSFGEDTQNTAEFENDQSGDYRQDDQDVHRGNAGISLSLLKEIGGEGIPKYTTEYSNDAMFVTVREYIEGIPLDRYASENELSREQITDICMQLCDILAHLHHRDEPIIHRDIKPQNIIVRLAETESWAETEAESAAAETETESDAVDLETGTDAVASETEAGTDAETETEAEADPRRQEKLHIALIDFDIARVHNSENDTDTRFIGTVAYAPPEQYGFSQTDARADIYSLGVLLRFLLTGSPRENKNISVYKPLAEIIDKCTAFSPEDRYSDIDQVKKALAKANPSAQRLRIAKIIAACLLAAVLFGFTGFQIYKAVTWTPFSEDAIPAYTSDEERVADAVSYMNDKFDTELFSGNEGGLDGMTGTDAVATIGLLKTVLIDCYGLDADYVNAPNTEMPHESEDFFLPWTWNDSQTINRSVMVYVAVKLYDPERVADWSSLKDDNGEYPGERVAAAFAEETGIMTGANRPDDITIGEMALILANTDRVFTAAGAVGE